MARRITQKELKHDEFIEVAFDFGHWIEENWPVVLKWLVVAAVVVLGIVGWMAYASSNAKKTRTLLAEGISQYQKSDREGFTNANAASGMLETFQEVSRRGGGSESAEVAGFLEGATLFRLGRLDEAASVLGAACSDPTDTICASSQMLLARVHADAGRVDDAVAVLQALAGHDSPVVPADRALLEMGRLQSNAGRADEARRIFQRIVNEFPLSGSAAEARELLQ